MKRSYWLKYPRGFSNEYDIGVATTGQHAEDYRKQGYHRVTREHALRLMTRRGDAATQIHRGVTLDGDYVLIDGWPDDGKQLARQLRSSHAA